MAIKTQHLLSLCHSFFPTVTSQSAFWPLKRGVCQVALQVSKRHGLMQVFPIPEQSCEQLQHNFLIHQNLRIASFKTTQNYW